jgi:hypothetical protein
VIALRSLRRTLYHDRSRANTFRTTITTGRARRSSITRPAHQPDGQPGEPRSSVGPRHQQPQHPTGDQPEREGHPDGIRSIPSTADPTANNTKTKVPTASTTLLGHAGKTPAELPHPYGRSRHRRYRAEFRTPSRKGIERKFCPASSSSQHLGSGKSETNEPVLCGHRGRFHPPASRDRPILSRRAESESEPEPERRSRQPVADADRSIGSGCSCCRAPR